MRAPPSVGDGFGDAQREDSERGEASQGDRQVKRHRDHSAPAI